MANRLARETSPYLLQHAENPVDWYPWGEEAFARAREEDRAVLVSIGYSACHWCHVMERESFEDDEIAQLMNERFVCIKVDREEHPDVDAIYMDAVQAMTGQGGWPLNAFLTPDGVPFWAGTYFPPEPRQGMPSWPQVLTAIGAAWDEQREEIRSQAGGDRRAAARRGRAEAAGGGDRPRPRSTPPSPRCASSTTPSTAASARAPKFPPASAIEFLLGRGEREMALHTLRRMAERRHVRPDRRRLRPLLGRPHLARPALREDALRQRAARPRLPARLAGHRRAAVRARVPRDARLGAAPSCARRRARSPPRSTPTPRASRASSTSGRSPRCARCSATSSATEAIEHFGMTEARQLRGRATSPCARRPTRRTATSCARGSTRRARSACGRASTTSA